MAAAVVEENYTVNSGESYHNDEHVEFDMETEFQIVQSKRNSVQQRNMDEETGGQNGRHTRANLVRQKP